VNLELAEKTAYITGGAHGLGEAIADVLAAEGVRVAVSDVDEAQLARKKKEWSRLAEAVVIPVDLSTQEGSSWAAEQAMLQLGSVPDILINNVGVGLTKSFAETSDDDWRRLFETNFFSHVRASRVIIPAMAARGSGYVVNMCSDLAKQPEAATAAYSATKVALLALTKILSLEFASSGIRVNAVCPGPIWTGHWTKPGGVVDQLMKLYAVEDRESAVQRFVGDRKIPFGVGRPSSVANFVAFLVSMHGSHLTGSVYDINGGSVRSLF